MKRSDEQAIRALGFKPESLPPGTLINGKPVDFKEPEKKKEWKPKQMNETEAAFSRHLDWLILQGLVHEWWYEPMTLKLSEQDPKTHRRMTYTPDFLVDVVGKPRWFIEIKGEHIWEDAEVKFKFARTLYGRVFNFTMLQKNGIFWDQILGDNWGL